MDFYRRPQKLASYEKLSHNTQLSNESWITPAHITRKTETMMQCLKQLQSEVPTKQDQNNIARLFEV